MNYDPLKQSWYQYHPLSEKHPHAFFKHKAVKFYIFFKKVFRLYAVGLPQVQHIPLLHDTGDSLAPYF